MEKLKTNKDLIEVIEARKKLATVIKKYKDGWKQRITITDFKQPVMFLLRKNMNIDFFEANKQNSLARGRFRYTHSGGKSMEVNLDDNYLYTVKYGNGQFKAYVHHEDYAFPLPQNPILYMTAFKDAVQHSLSAELKWKAVERLLNFFKSWL